MTSSLARSALLGTTLAGALAVPAGAQDKPTLLDFLSPDRIAARMIQSGIMGLRTQFDVVYGDITTNVLAGTVSLTDVKAWPQLDWDVEVGCEIAFDRLKLSTVPIEELDLVRVRAQASGGSFSSDCLPPDARGSLAMLGLGDSIPLGRVSLDVEYRISTASAATHLYAVSEGLAAISSDIDFDYLWIDTFRKRDPEPVVFLTGAELTVENLGLWEKVQPMLPPPATDPAQAGQMVDAFLTGAMPPLAPGATPSPERDAFKASVTEAWTAFLAQPQKLVLETGFDRANSVYLPLKDWETNPEGAIDTLKPRLVVTPAPARAMLPSALLTKATDTPDQLTEDERLRIGTALATGVGAPRDLALAETVLGPAVDAGNGAAALALARALKDRDAPKAYALALLAAESGTAGSAGLLDAIEAALPLKTVLDQQHVLVEGVEHPVQSLEHLALVRDEAVKRMTGNGRSRSYEVAALWALIGAAAGDAECADILAEIDAIVARGGPDAAATWAAQEASSAELARSAWVGFDLPQSFGGVQ